jgi:transcriptional regulator with XRE-family HTH domain
MLQDNLKRLRKKRKLTQPRISMMLGVPRSTYSSWEYGVSEPSITSLKKIAKFHSISLDELCK